MIKFSIWAIATLLFLGLGWYFIMPSLFPLFDPPERIIIQNVCDHEGLRQVQLYGLGGNAVTNSSVHVSVYPGCGEYDGKIERKIFTADYSSITENDVIISMVAFDTLLIAYKPGLRVFAKVEKVVFPDSTLNLFVAYKEIE